MPENYLLYKRQMQSLFETERDLIANMANFSSFLFNELTRVNWLGFYFMRDRELVLGPFQGKVACVRLPLGKGVCSAAVLKKETVIVSDVHAFPGHIACDADSRSEIVVPLIINDQVRAVLDIDSPVINRFTESDKQGLQELTEVLIQRSNFSYTL